MQRLDDIFFHVAHELNVTGEYSPRHMNYECMRTVMDYHTTKCGKLSDYGLMFAKYYADACHSYSAGKIIEKILCWFYLAFVLDIFYKKFFKLLLIVTFL